MKKKVKDLKTEDKIRYTNFWTNKSTIATIYAINWGTTAGTVVVLKGGDSFYPLDDAEFEVIEEGV